MRCGIHSTEIILRCRCMVGCSDDWDMYDAQAAWDGCEYLSVLWTVRTDWSIVCLRERVGYGHSAAVYRARDGQGATVALKIFDCGRRGVEEFVQELEAYVRLNSEQWGVCRYVCEGIVARRDVDRMCSLFASVIGFGVSDRSAYVCIPLFPITLADALRLPGISPLAHRDVSVVFSQVARGVRCKYLHRCHDTYSLICPQTCTRCAWCIRTLSHQISCCVRPRRGRSREDLQETSV